MDNKEFENLIFEMGASRLIARGYDEETTTKWLLFAIEGRNYYTIETQLFGDTPPVINMVDSKNVGALLDDALIIDSTELNVISATEAMKTALESIGSEETEEIDGEDWMDELPDINELPDTDEDWKEEL